MTTNKLIFSIGKEERKAQTKTGVIFSLIFLTLFFSLTNVMAIPDDAGDTIDFTYTAAVNYSAQNVNNSQYHQGYTPQQVADLYVETDPDWAANYSNFSVGWNYATNASGNYVPYTGATTDVDLGLNDFIARYGNFTLDLDVMDDLFVWDNTDLYGQLDVWERARFYGSLECNDSISLEVTGNSIMEIETTWTNSSAQLRMLADGTNDLYIYTYGSTAAATYYGLPRASSSYVDAQGDRLIIGTFDTSPLYLATSQSPRFELTTTGDLIPFDDDDYDIGNSSHRITDIFVTGENGDGGIRFTEDDGSYGNLTMDDDFNLSWDGGLNVVDDVYASRFYQTEDTPHMYGIVTAPHTVAVASTWYNFTFNDTESILEGNFTFEDNRTLTIMEDGDYLIDVGVSILDAAASPSANVAIRIIKNGAQLTGSYFETTTSKQNANQRITKLVYVELEYGDKLTFQYISDATTVSINSLNTWNTGVGQIAYGWIQRID